MTTSNLMTVPQDVKARVNAKIDECIKKVNARYNTNMRPINVAYDINSSRLGGQAIHSERRVRINPAFLTLYTEHYLNTTVPHEVAHIAVGDVHGHFGVSSHGREWKLMMSVVGAPANRCHSYETPMGVKLGKPKTKHHYVCQQCGKDHFVGPKIHAKIKRGSRYWHITCGKERGILVYADTVGKVSYSEAEHIIKQPKAPSVPVKKSDNGDHAGMTKFDRCLAIYMSHPGKTRKVIINKFVDEVEMTPQGASTYYSKCVKEATNKGA